MSRAQALAKALGQPKLWAGRQLAVAPAISTGFSSLDAVLPGQGWPLGAVTELIPHTEGIGELSLLVPALLRLQQAGQRIALINPPYIPYAPALRHAGLSLKQLVWVKTEKIEDAHWAGEQALKGGSVGAALLWSHRIGDHELRRLQLAAEEGQALGFLYRPISALRNSSPAAVRLSLQAAIAGLRIEVIKARGGHQGASVLCAIRRPGMPQIGKTAMPPPVSRYSPPALRALA
jgi:protein ImuA